MDIKNDKELIRLRTRVKEEFIIVKGMQNADIESAMINVDNLIDYLLERSDNSDYASAVKKLIDVNVDYVETIYGKCIKYDDVIDCLNLATQDFA